jgi:hypothetical protein
MSSFDRGLDWARIPEPEQEELEARAKRASIRFEWTADDHAKVLAEFDGLEFVEIGRLEFDWQHGWFFHRFTPEGPVGDGGDDIDVDPEARLDFTNELAAAQREEPGVREVKTAELRGRILMHRDDTRDMAVIGTKVLAKRWLPKYLSLV